MVKAAVIGAAGYTGIETVRLLLGHPGFDLTLVTSAAESGRSVEDVFPSLAGCGLVFRNPDATAVADVADIAFLAVPHTAALALVPDLLRSGVRVFDLSADFRLTDPALYENWYGTPHTAPGLLSETVYGLPELVGDSLIDARLVACPGCYPTASVLAAFPALESGLVSATSKVVIDAKSGVSGAGRTPTPTAHYASANESVSPYAVGVHRHTPEIAQALSGVVGAPVSVCFAPHLVPMTRGLLATAYLDARPGLTAVEAVEVYRARYETAPFVTVHDAGRMPSTREVSGTNRAHIGIAVDGASGTLVVACAIDNLVKGSGGQAIQCANIALGLPETHGLAAFGPVV